MSKNEFKKSIASNSTLIPSSINHNYSNLISNSNLNQNNQNFSSFSNIEFFDEDSDFFAPSTVKNHTGRIIHQTTEQSIDRKGNRVIKIKTVREIDSNLFNGKQKNKKIKIITKNKSQNNYKNLNLNYNYNTNINDKLNQKELYSSPDFIESSPNYIKNKNEIISPNIYFPNGSSGSDYEEKYYTKSFERNNNKYLNRLKKIKKINYELESPKTIDYLNTNEFKNIKRIKKLRKKRQNSKISQIIFNKSEYYNRFNKGLSNNSYQSEFLDFQSPDRDNINQNKFRKISDNMINSKGPTNDDKKVTKSIKNKMILENNKYIKSYKNKKINKNILTKTKAAKIIQLWWRNNYLFREKEIYNIAVKSAIKLQSFIRAYLTRKKVLRYITLALYYQSFCEKIQNVINNNIKKNIFNILKKYKKPKFKKSSTTLTKIISNNNSRSFISSIGNQSPETYQTPLTFIISNNNSNNKNNNYKNRNVLRKYKNNLVDNYERVTTTTTRIITSNTKKIKNKNYYKNEIMSGGTLSIIKLPNRRINYSESEDVFSHVMKEKQKKIYLNNNSDYKNEERRNSSSNIIYEKKMTIAKSKPELYEDNNYNKKVIYI